MNKSCPKYLKNIQFNVAEQLKLIKKPSSDLLEKQQLYCDEVLEIYRKAFQDLISNTNTYAGLLNEIKNVYENALNLRDKRISLFITQDNAFGTSKRKKQYEDKIKFLLDDNESLKKKNLKLSLEVSKLQNDLIKMKQENFSEYLKLVKERDKSLSLYREKIDLEERLRQLDCSAQPPSEAGDPVTLRIALDRCRVQLTSTQRELSRLRSEYSDTVPAREHAALERALAAAARHLDQLTAEHAALQDAFKKCAASKKGLEEELSEVRERCSELERAGTPRPQWEACADFIGGGRERWRRLAHGRSSRDALRVLLQELGPAAQQHHLEFFDGLGTDPSVPPYLRYSGRVRNLRLSRRELNVIVHDIWQGKLRHGADLTMQEYFTKYFEDRYQQPSVRAEWAYNVCAGAEQALDEPQVQALWGALTGRLSEDVYWGLRAQWYQLKEAAYRASRDGETITIEEFEKVAKATFPLKSEIDIKTLVDVARKQLKLKLNNSLVALDKLFQENEEGFDRVEVCRELHRQRRAAQDKYVREVVAALGGRRAPPAVSVDALKRAFAIVDPAIDHIRMDRYIRWAFSLGRGASAQELGGAALPVSAVAARLAAGDVERAGPRTATSKRHRQRYKYH